MQKRLDQGGKMDEMKKQLGMREYREEEAKKK